MQEEWLHLVFKQDKIETWKCVFPSYKYSGLSSSLQYCVIGQKTAF